MRAYGALHGRRKAAEDLGVSRHMSALGTRPKHRYFPTDKGVIAGGMATEGRAHMLGVYIGVEAVVPPPRRAAGQQRQVLRHPRR